MKKLIVIFLTCAFILSTCKPQSKTMATNDTSQQKPNAELEGTYWRLIEVMGKPVPPLPQDKREAHMILKKQDNRLNAFGGCNTLSGGYEIKEGYQIRFSNVISTMMACPDMTVEDELKKVFGMADNYSIKGDSLSLNKARMAPLARFAAVYFK